MGSQHGAGHHRGSRTHTRYAGGWSDGTGPSGKSRWRPTAARRLGMNNAAVLLPWDSTQSCEDLTPQIADALFGIESQSTATPERPRLGVMLEQNEQAVRVAKITEGSVAERAGLQQGDIIESVAGERVGVVDDVIATISRQAPGTWLPISIRRDGKSLDIVARFPPRSKP